MATEFENDIVHCLDTLHRGGVILYPTDTIWGIGCDATNAAAVKKVYEIKRRPESKSLIVLLADVRDLNRYVSQLQPEIFDYLQTVARPTTVVYDGAVGLAENLVAEDGSVGIRVVKEDFCRHLIKRFRKPLVSTSANISGSPAPGNFSNVSGEIREAVDYIVQYRQLDNQPAMASTVVRFDRSGRLQVLRP
ncbi:MAG TPA: L-threonylcarbamoyladenylate synthase [Puia sp.]|nr:L-threonylcarbamoyladenylate synthase [Puia sp.]